MAVVGIDIGGTKTIVALADDSGSIISQVRIRTPREEGPECVLSAIKSTVVEITQQPGSPAGAVEAIGIGCGGPLDRDRGVILTAPNLPGWDGLDIARYFSTAFDVPVFLDNDVNLAALGETRKGACAEVDYAAYFNIGTGIGGGIIIKRKLYRGCGNAGEFGHQIILPDGPRCLCGRHGCLEALASGTSIARRAKECLEGETDNLMVHLAGKAGAVTAEHVAEAARAGDALAAKIWRDTAFYLGIGIANVVNVLNPQIVVVGGGVAKAGDLLFEPVRHTVAENAMRELVSDTLIVPAALGDEAGVTGAVYLAIEREESGF